MVSWLCLLLAPKRGIHPLHHHHQCLGQVPLEASSFSMFLPELTSQKVSLLYPCWGLWKCGGYLTGGYYGI